MRWIAGWTGGIFCSGSVPMLSGFAEMIGEIDQENPLHLDACSKYSDSGIIIRTNVNADMSKDFQTMKTYLEIEISLPDRNPIYFETL
ncbi:MAG: hypothetical protein MUO26_14030 [Methanotrichaceae archaeon]|nr:hypothetical protein [Methanotrichaceae archaeon]